MALPETNQIDYFDQQVSQMSKAEILAFQKFEEVYQIQHPVPVRDRLHLRWEFWTAMATSTSAVVLAAFRTGQAFYISAVAKGNELFSSLEAIAAVFAIEGSVVLFALQRARRQNKTDDFSSEIGLWVAFTISALAGLFQSVNLVQGAPEWAVGFLSFSLIVAMGLGATVIAWLGGDILGVHLVRLEQGNFQADEHLANSNRSYRANLLKAWMNSDERTAVHEHKVRRYGTNRSDERSHEQVHTNRSNEQGSRTEFTNGSHEPYPPITRDEIFAHFDTVLSGTGQVAGVNDTAREMAKKRNPDGSETGWENLKGRISGLRKQWMIEHHLEGE